MNKCKNIADLDIVDITDLETKTKLPLKEKEVGSIIYEHCFVEKLFRDVYVGTAERNYYIDRYHELCLCVNYNRRILGTYEFTNGYQFFVTKKRMALDIYWNLGNISDKSMILEYYDSLEEAAASKYYDDYCDLKDEICKSIKYKKAKSTDPFKLNTISCGDVVDEFGNKNHIVFEIPVSEKKEFIQFYFDNDKDEWEKMSVSPEPLLDKMVFFPDFDDIDRNILHLRCFNSLDMNELEKEPLYSKAYDMVKEVHEDMKLKM